jgi:hypothetical protein
LTIPTESEEQIGFLQWWERQFPTVWIYHIPNGGRRAISTAKRMKAEGVKPGVPDLHVPAWSLWIEMKRRKGGRVSPDQAAWIEYLEGIGHTVIVGRGAEDASRQVLEFSQARLRQRTG